AAVYQSPSFSAAEAFALAGTLSAFEGFVVRVRRGLARYEARTNSIAKLRDLAEWLDTTWAATCSDRIGRDIANREMVCRVKDALPTLAPFQQFRTRATQLTATALETFASLRTVESALVAVGSSNLAEEVRRVIEREARLAWKARIEGAQPALLL